MKITMFAATLLAAITPAAVFAQDAATYEDKTPAANPEVANPSDLTLSIGLSAATDYVWRGVSQSNNDPAVFGTIGFNHKGFYAGMGTENVDFAGIDQEWDLWAGYVVSLGKIKLDLGVVRYGYVDAPADIDTLEAKAALTGNAGKLGGGIAVYHTRDYFGTRQDATYVEASASYRLTEKLSISSAFGHQQISNLPNYSTWNLGLSYAVGKGSVLGVRYHDTDTDAFGRLGNGRVVGLFSLSF